jgi:hypothetical protein
MATVISIASVDRSAYTRLGSITVEERLDNRSTMRATFMSASYRPAPMETVSLTIDGVTAFAGIITEVEEEAVADTNWLRCTITAADYSLYADRIIASYTWANKTLKQIATDLITLYLGSVNGFNITLSMTPTGPTLNEVWAEYVTVTDFMNYLTKVTGWSWSIDYSKVLTFALPSTKATPYVLTSANILTGAKVKVGLTNYRNRQYVRYAGPNVTHQSVSGEIGSPGNRGEWQMFTDAPDIDKLTDANALANGLLGRYAYLAQIASFSIRTSASSGLFHPGQQGSVTLAAHNLSGNFTISSVTHRHEPVRGNDTGSWFTDIEAISGADRQGGQSWVDMWDQMLNGSGGASSGGASGSSGGSGVVYTLSGAYMAFLGGSRFRDVIYTPSGSPNHATPVPEYVDVVLDSARFLGQTVNCRCWVRTTNSGTSVQPEVWNVTDGVQAGIGSSTTSTSWVDTPQTFSITLATGIKTYRLRLIPGNGTYGVQGLGMLYV